MQRVAARLIARKVRAATPSDSWRMTASTKTPPATPRRSRRRLLPRGAAKVIGEAATDDGTVVAHPDGYYWLGPDGDAEFGPFDSRGEALADRDRYNEEAPSEGESVQEAEREIGLNDWIDAETGAPAEGQSPPHLEET
jgi:hypothetical protein